MLREATKTGGDKVRGVIGRRWYRVRGGGGRVRAEGAK